MKAGLTINFDDVAAFLAHEDDDVQAKFLNVFCDELKSACGTNYHAEVQMAAIVSKMKSSTKELFLMVKEDAS